MSVSSLEQGLRTRMWVIDIPVMYREDFIQLILKWVRCSGEEWTIKRLKSLKVDLYRRKAGLPSQSWVRKNRKGDIAGCIGGLFRWSDKSDKNFRKVVQTLMCYTVFVYSVPTSSQVKKFTEALAASPPPLWRNLSRFSKSIKKNFGSRTVDRTSEVSLLLYRGSSSKRKPSTGMRSVPQDSNILEDSDLLVASDRGKHVVYKYQKLFAPVFKGLDHYPKLPPYFVWVDHEIDPMQIEGGKIAFIQEPGGKLRSVASPFLAYQLALRHFGSAVYELARHLPWDCTHDQSKPVRTIQDRMRDGTTIHSVDLTSATDYFPLEVQVSAMRAIYGNIDDIALFELISRSKWSSPVGEVRWNRGQPLGLFPSFAVFTVTHGLLLWYLNGETWNKDFFVLGDDVVILNDNLYHRYIETLNTWGCPYSPDKSISSSQICEFAGKVITSELLIPQFKWREISNNNFVDIARQLGQRSRILLSKRQKAVFDKIKHCTSPKGLGFSYQGSTLTEMESLTHQIFGSPEEKVLDSLVDQAGVIYRNLYGSPRRNQVLLSKPTEISVPVVLEMVATFDKKVRMVLQSLLPWFHEEIHDPRLYSGVPGGLGNTELPPVKLLPSRLTSLDRYERLLGIDNQ